MEARRILRERQVLSPRAKLDAALLTIPGRADPEFRAECTVEIRDVAEPCLERHIQDFCVTARQTDGRLSQPGTEHVLMRAGPGDALEHSQVIERAEPGLLCQAHQRQIELR